MIDLQLSDDYPVLLGPVRLETRFTDTHLQVRIFPDDWAVDSFEPRPTAAEIDALDAYWIAVWRAGGDKTAEQAAWRELGARIAPGRASWLLTDHQPANPDDQPTGVPASTTVLVVVSAAPVPPAQRQPTVDYWTAIWRARGDRAKIRAAELALIAAAGNDADDIRARRAAGIDHVPPGAGDEVAVVFLVLPQPPPAEIAPQAWTTAARARLLPDRFVAIGYAGGQQVFSVPGSAVADTLAVSPDPSATDQLTLDADSGELHVPDDLRWLTEFDRAVEVGMGLTIPLTDVPDGGLDLLVVLGLRETATPAQSGADLTDLIQRQLRSQAGFSLIPQGTPTNNSEQVPAGPDPRAEAESRRTSTFAELAERTSDTVATTALTAGDTWMTKTDGQWFAELLGIDPAALAGMAGADGTDLRDARAANTALWPATWGYFLQSMLHPILPAGAVEETRRFFLRHVSGRGPMPVARIGRLPYGFLPTTAFSQLTWPAGATHRKALHGVLSAAMEDWRFRLNRVSHLGEDGDPHQLLLDILALHPTSAEYHQRYAHSVEDIYNRENLSGLGPTVVTALAGLNMPQPVRALLASLGHTGADPDIIRRLFTRDEHPLLGPLVDDRPLSETDPVRGYAFGGEKNYLRWLADAARAGLETIRLEQGFDDGTPPAALLYLLLRHAMLLGWEDAGRRLAAAAGSPVPSTADEPFVHVRLANVPSESRFRQLYSPDPAITGDQNKLVVDAIPGLLDTDPGSPALQALDEQIHAVELLADVPTARLERVLAEHLDCATYRLDAWRLALANERLAELRYGDGTTPPRRGIHLGAYGWLEHVEPAESKRTAYQPPAALAGVFGADVEKDPANGGYVHAPSISQATTAAVLRAGYVTNRTPEKPERFAVNLSSERIRLALTILDGLREGQSLGALLGYRLERGLHERYPEFELDRFIQPLRAEFPLRAGRLPGAVPGPDVDVKVVEARNVIDGLALVRRVTREDGVREYPFGLGLPRGTTEEEGAIDEEVDKLLDIHDALADLAVAEGAHQAILGNPERASASLDGYSKAGLPPDPAVIRTPRGGTTLTHRLGLVLKPGNPTSADSPRARAEPAVNDWLPTFLPKPHDVAALVTWVNPADGKTKSRVVTQDDIGLSPIDLLWALRPATEAAMTDLDDRILGAVVKHPLGPRPDVEPTIRYTERVNHKITFFEVSALVAALRSLLTTSRPLRPTDLMPGAGTAPVDPAEDSAVDLPKKRPVKVREALDGLGDDVADYLKAVAPLFPEPPAPVNRAKVLTNIDDILAGYAELAVTAGGFGMTRAGWGEVTAWRRGVYRDVLAAVGTVVDRMTATLAKADALLAAEKAVPPPPVEERFRLLQQAERLLTTKPTVTRPSDPKDLRKTVDKRRKEFNDKLGKLRAIPANPKETLHELITQVRGQLPITDFDAEGLDLTPFEDRVVAFAAELLGRARALAAEVTARLTSADTALAEYDVALPGPDRVEAATAALKAMLGEDVLAVPQFTPSQKLADEWEDAHDDSADLLEHLTDAGRDFPVDDWLHGMARVREKPRLWERVILLGDALRGSDGFLGDLLDDLFGKQEAGLTPIQLPHREPDHWLAMEFAPGTAINEDRLLFTAHYGSTFPDFDDPQVGLLFDEWTEVIPAEKETTGIAVHYDGPNSEPPQAMLLVTPPARTGTWDWDDLVAAISETLELAKTRAVEPAHLEDTAYAHLLPATVLSATHQPITISTDLAIANLRWKTRD